MCTAACIYNIYEYTLSSIFEIGHRVISTKRMREETKLQSFLAPASSAELSYWAVSDLSSLLILTTLCTTIGTTYIYLLHLTTKRLVNFESQKSPELHYYKHVTKARKKISIMELLWSNASKGKPRWISVLFSGCIFRESARWKSSLRKCA